MISPTFVIPWLKDIAIVRLRFFYSAASRGSVAWHLGPEIRGSIGNILKTSQGCTQDHNEDCKNCLKKADCVYIKNFGKDNHIPKCFHLKIGPSFRSLKTSFASGETLQFDMVCFGLSAHEIFDIVQALRSSPLRLGPQGLKFYCMEYGLVDPGGGFLSVVNTGGEFNVPTSFQPVSILSAENKLPPTQISCIHFDIHTPAEISYKENKFLQNPKNLSFETLVRKMLGRTLDVARHHFNFQWDEQYGSIQDFKNHVIDMSGEVELVELPQEKINAGWIQVPHRNKQGKKFGGLVGSFVYKGRLTPFFDLIHAICLLGLGKNTISGFGHCSYQVIEE